MNLAKDNPYIKVRVYAGLRRERVTETASHQFEIVVREPAQHNAANRRVQVILAEHYQVPVARIRLVSGHHSPQKIFTITKQS